MKSLRPNVLAPLAGAAMLLSLTLAGCSNDATTSAQFAASATPPSPGLVKLAQRSVSGSQVLVDVLLNGPEPALDLYAFRFAIRISDTSAVRFVPQSSYVQSVLVADTGQTIIFDVDASDPSEVNIEVVKQGGGAGNGLTSPAAVVIELTFEVLGSGGSALSLSGIGASQPQAFDRARNPIEAVHFDTASASLAGVRMGGGGY